MKTFLMRLTLERYPPAKVSLNLTPRHPKGLKWRFLFLIFSFCLDRRRYSFRSQCLFILWPFAEVSKKKKRKQQKTSEKETKNVFQFRGRWQSAGDHDERLA